MKKVYVVKAKTGWDFPTEEIIIVASTEAKANSIKRIIEKFIMNDCLNYAGALGYDFDFMNISFFLKEGYLRDKLITSLSCCMNKDDASDFISKLMEVDVNCTTNVCSIEESMYYI